MELEGRDRLRRRLIAQRAELLQQWRHVLSEENEMLMVHGPDWEDTAEARTAAVVLESINARERCALAGIQSSLARIERGTYGECTVCHATIDEERLCAVPDTDRCGACAPFVN